MELPDLMVLGSCQYKYLTFILASGEQRKHSAFQNGVLTHMATCCAVLEKQVAKSGPNHRVPKDLLFPDSYTEKLCIINSSIIGYLEYHAPKWVGMSFFPMGFLGSVLLSPSQKKIVPQRKNSERLRCKEICRITLHLTNDVVCQTEHAYRMY